MLHRSMPVENRHGKMKIRAFAYFAFHPDTPAVRFNQVFGDRQTEPRPARLARSRRVDTVKPLENPRLVCPRNADAGIGHGEHHFQFADRHTQYDLAARQGVLPRVIQQILQYLGQPAAVAGDTWWIFRNVHRKLQTIFQSAVLRRRQAAVDDLRHANLVNL